MKTVKLIYIRDSIEYVEYLVCSSIMIDSVITAFKKNMYARIAKHIDVSILQYIPLTDTSFVFVFDIGEINNIGGYGIFQDNAPGTSE